MTPTAAENRQKAVTSLEPTIMPMVQQHFAVIVSAVLVAFCAVRILLFAKGDFALALAVLNVGQQFTILTSTLFTLLTAASLYAIFLPQISKYVLPDVHQANSFLSAGVQGFLFAICFTITVLTAPMIFLGFGLLLVAVLAVINVISSLRTRRSDSTGRWTHLIRKFALGCVSAAVLGQVLFLVLTPWVPSETLTVERNGQITTVSGYVMGQQGKQTLVVNMKKTTATWISEDDLGERVLCTGSRTLKDWYWKTLGVGLSNDPSAIPIRPDCKE